MGIIAWIVLGLGAGLLANMAIPGKRSQGLILTCVIGIAGALGRHPPVPRPHPERVLQPVHLAHRHRRRSRPAAHLPPDQRPVHRFPPVRAPLSTASTAPRKRHTRSGPPASVNNSDSRSAS